MVRITQLNRLATHRSRNRKNLSFLRPMIVGAWLVSPLAGQTMKQDIPSVLPADASPAATWQPDPSTLSSVRSPNDSLTNYPVTVAVDVSAEPGVEGVASDSHTLDSLIHMALSTHPEIQRVAAMAQSARGRAWQVGVLPNPTIGFEGQQLASDGRAEQYGVALGQEWVRSDKRSLARATILQEAEQWEQRWSEERFRVMTKVRIAYYRAIRAQQQRAVVVELESIAQRGLELSQALFRAGEVGRTDPLQAELEVESATMLRQTAENRYRAAWKELEVACGQSHLEPRPLQGDLLDHSDALRFEEELSRIQQGSPELAAILESIDRARFALQRQLIETRPDLSIQGLYNWRDNGTDGDPNAAVAVSIPFPFWHRNQGGIQEARCQLAAAQRELSARELAIQERLASVFERYLNARTQATVVSERILPKAQESLALHRQAYEAGQIGFANVLTAQRTYTQNRLALLDALEAMRVSEAEIQGFLVVGNAQDNDSSR